MAKEQTFEHPPRGHVALLVYDPTNDRFNVVQGDDVDTAIPAAGKALLASALAHGYDGSAWRKLPLLWGYSDTYSEAQDENYTSTGAQVLSSTAVPSGYVYVVTAIGAYYNTGTVTSMTLYLSMGAGDLPMGYLGTPAVNEILPVTGMFPLKATQLVKALFVVTAQPCHCYLVVAGYKMAITM